MAIIFSLPPLMLLKQIGGSLKDIHLFFSTTFTIYLRTIIFGSYLDGKFTVWYGNFNAANLI